jgi:transcriptional regulator with XRE-family HTH domain
MTKQINPAALKKLRKLKGLSHQALAEKANTAKSTVIGLEKPLKEPSETMRSVRDRIYDALQLALGATDAQMRGEEPPRESLPLKFVPLKGTITTMAQMNYDLISDEYGVGTDQLLQIAPLMFAILVEDSFAWRREQLELRKQIQDMKKRTRESQYDPEPDISDDDIEAELRAEEASIAARDVFSYALIEANLETHGGLYSSDRFTDFIAAKVKSSDGRIRADLTIRHLEGRDIRDPDTKYVAAAELLDAKTPADDLEAAAFIRLLLMSGLIRLHDFRSGRTPEQLKEWLRSEVLPNLETAMLAFAPEVYRLDTETEGLSLDPMGFPIRARRHPLAPSAMQSEDQGDESEPA